MLKSIFITAAKFDCTTAQGNAYDDDEGYDDADDGGDEGALY